MDAAGIQRLILDFLQERFDVAPDSVTPTTTLRDLGLDSMAMLEVMIELEDRLGVKLKDLTIPPNPSLGDVVALVERNLKQGA